MQPPRLRTERLLLREFRPEDVEPHYEMARDEEVQRFLGGLKSAYDAFGNLATHAGQLGAARLRRVRRRTAGGRGVPRAGRVHRAAGLAADRGRLEARARRLGPRLRDRGGARRDRFGFTALDMPELCSLIDPANAGSAAVARRLGYENTGPIETPFGMADRWVIRRGRR